MLQLRAGACHGEHDVPVAASVDKAGHRVALPGLPSDRKGGSGREGEPLPRGAPWETASRGGLLGAPQLCVCVCDLQKWVRFSYPRERGVMVDNQSVFCALVKGCSKSWDMQLLSTPWQLTNMRWRCRVWIEWVPSDSNPADILSREGRSLFATSSGAVDAFVLPPWADLTGSKNISKVFDDVAHGEPRTSPQFCGKPQGRP